VAQIRALRARMTDVTTRLPVVGDDVVVVEGDCLPATVGHVAPAAGRPATKRIPLAMVLEIAQDGIVAIRLYLTVSRLPRAGRPPTR
jgi:hypothetical protein